VLDGTQLPLPQKYADRQFLAHVYCGQTAGWMKMTFPMEVGLGPGQVVLDEDPAPIPQNGAKSPIFGPCLLRPNGWMDQDATCCGGMPRPRRHCVGWGPNPSIKRKGYSLPIIGPCLLRPNGCVRVAHGTEIDLGPGDIGLDGDPAPLPLNERSPRFWSMSVVAKRPDGLSCHLVRR